MRALNASQVGEKLGLHRGSCYRLRDQGKLPEAKKIGAAVRWLESDIDQWLEWGCPSESEFRKLKKDEQRLAKMAGGRIKKDEQRLAKVAGGRR